MRYQNDQALTGRQATLTNAGLRESTRTEISTVMSRIASNQRHTDFSERLNVFPCSSEFSVYNYVLAISWGFTTVITFSFSSVKGWFYKDFFLGSEPNKKLEKERGKKYKARSGSEPLPPFRSLLQ